MRRIAILCLLAQLLFLLGCQGNAGDGSATVQDTLSTDTAEMRNEELIQAETPEEEQVASEAYRPSDEEVESMLRAFIRECYNGQNFYALVRDNDGRLDKYLDPAIELVQIFMPDSEGESVDLPCLRTRDNGWVISDNKDLRTKRRVSANCAIVHVPSEDMVGTYAESPDTIYCCIGMCDEDLPGVEAEDRPGMVPITNPMPGGAVVGVSLPWVDFWSDAKSIPILRMYPRGAEALCLRRYSA